MRMLVVLACVSACGSSAGVDDAGLDAPPDALADASADAAAADAETDADRDAGLGRFAPSYPTSAAFIEGGAYSDALHEFYVGSLADGSVHAIDGASGEERVLFEPSEPGTWWTLGMDVDDASRRLFVCAMDDRREMGGEVPYDGYVWVFDLSTGDRIATHDLADAAPNATCTDVAFASDGSLYVCDRENPRIYRIDTEGAISVFAEDDVLGGLLAGQNALVVLPDQSALLSVVYQPSRLAYVSLSDGAVREVDIEGDFSDRLPVLSGADGMAWDDGTVLVAFTSQINRVTPTVGDWSAATSTTVDVPAGMTDVVMTPGGAYLLNGQAVDFALGNDPEPSVLRRFEGDI